MSAAPHTNVVARTYARALLEAAGPERRDAMGEALAEVVRLLQADTSLRTFLETPAVQPEAKKRVLESLRGRLDDLLVNFLCVIADKSRADQLDEIAVAYGELADQAAGRARVRVTTAVPLPDDLRRTVHDQLSRRIGKGLILEAAVEPELLGGMVVLVGDRVYEGSVRGALRRMHEQMVRSSGYED